MSAFLYAPKLYLGTNELIEALQAKRLVRHDGLHFLYKGTPVEFGSSDIIICWGAHAPPIFGVACLNANYAYPTMLDINTRGLAYLSNHGISAFQMVRIPSNVYAEGLKLLNPVNDWPTKLDPNRGTVSVPEFEGYGTQNYGFTAIRKVKVFGGNVLGGPADSQHPSVAYAIKAIESLNLHFGVVTVGTVNTSLAVVLKVITAPSLDAKGVEVYADLIKTWINSLSKDK